MIDRRRILDAWRRLDVVVRDLPLALLLTGFSFVPAMRGYGTYLGEASASVRPIDPIGVVAALLEGLPLALRRRMPAVSVALVFVGFVIDQLGTYRLFSGNAMTIAVVSTGAHLSRGRRVAAVLLTGGYVGLALALDQLGETERVTGFVTFYLAMVLAWAMGAWLRANRAAEAERRLRVEADTRAAERTRLARELHDVVTHHVTAMVVQAEAARYLTAVPDRLESTLGGITETGRGAIADLRHLLDVLDPSRDVRAPKGPVQSVDLLVERTRRAGQPVELTQTGTIAAAGAEAQLMAHQVVREALTNALKYARGRTTRVELHHTDTQVAVLVETRGGRRRGLLGAGSGHAARKEPSVHRADDDGVADDEGGGVAGGGSVAAGGAVADDSVADGVVVVGGSGRGLDGLRERVEALGGTFDAGPVSGGGFAVRARIPAQGES